MSQPSLLPYLWMLLGSLSFATMATLTYALRKHHDWQTIAFVRALLAFLIAVLLTKLAGARLVFWRPRVLWWRSIAGSVSMVCTFYALNRLPTANVMTVTNMFPIWVAILSWPLLREMPSTGVWISAGMGVIGVALIQQAQGAADSPVLQMTANPTWPMLVALIASVATAFAMLGLHQLAYLDPRAVVAHFSGVACVFCAASFFLFGRNDSLHNDLDAATVAMLIGVGVSATIGQLFLTKAFTTGAPAKVSVVGLTQILFAMGYDLVLWHHSFHPLMLVGTSLVIAPTAWLLTQRGGTDGPPDLGDPPLTA